MVHDWGAAPPGSASSGSQYSAHPDPTAPVRHDAGEPGCPGPRGQPLLQQVVQLGPARPTPVRTSPVRRLVTVHLRGSERPTEGAGVHELVEHLRPDGGVVDDQDAEQGLGRADAT